MPTTATRCYRFALRPSPTQAAALARATGQARRVWNELTALLRYAEREQRVGRRAALLHEYRRILAGKALTGAAYTKARRLMAERGLANRKDYDNALGVFTSILKDKAARASQPRQVLDVREAYTTCTCPDCGELAGPTGLQDLKVRVWTCTSCGQTHQRDFASVRAIARRTMALHTTAAGAQPAQPERSRPAGPLELHSRDQRRCTPARRVRSPRQRGTLCPNPSAAVAGQRLLPRAGNQPLEWR